MRLNAIDWMIFDAMGVLFVEGDDTGNLLVPFVLDRVLGVSAATIECNYRLASLGIIQAKDFWANVGLGHRYPQIEIEYLSNSFTLNAGVIEVCEELSEFCRLAILSNDVGDWSRFLRKHFGLDGLFEIAVISGEVGYRKPGREIYLLALDRLSALARNCLFIDDRLPNLITARELGFNVLQFGRGNPESHGIASVSSFASLRKMLKKNFRHSRFFF
jgi:FMN phosphatase YigB (HAD superfamily)